MKRFIVLLIGFAFVPSVGHCSLDGEELAVEKSDHIVKSHDFDCDYVLTLTDPSWDEVGDPTLFTLPVNVFEFKSTYGDTPYSWVDKTPPERFRHRTRVRGPTY